MKTGTVAASCELRTACTALACHFRAVPSGEHTIGL